MVFNEHSWSYHCMATFFYLFTILTTGHHFFAFVVYFCQFCLLFDYFLYHNLNLAHINVILLNLVCNNLDFLAEVLLFILLIESWNTTRRFWLIVHPLDGLRSSFISQVFEAFTWFHLWVLWLNIWCMLLNLYDWALLITRFFKFIGLIRHRIVCIWSNSFQLLRPSRFFPRIWTSW